MESITYFFFHQWQRKLMALCIAFLIWFFVNHSITGTKILPSVPIRVINLPVDKTIQGLLPNGFLSRRITLTLTGTKDVIEQLEPGDVEVLIDVSNIAYDGVVQITKKNLESLNPNINLLTHVVSVTHPEFGIKLSLLLTEKIPLSITPPTGSPPESYDFLDIWPKNLTQTVSGPQELILNLKNKGLEITFNLNEISKEELDDLKSYLEAPYNDEISFNIPDAWKKVVIPVLSNVAESLNDPEAKNLQINFLKKEFLPLKGFIPINVFYPLKYSHTINPKSHPLGENAYVEFKNNIPVLKIPIFAYNVSKLFLDIVKDHMQIDVTAAPKTERETLEWGIDMIDHTHLEDTYVAFSLSESRTHIKPKEKEEFFRQRFLSYMQKFMLFLTNHQPLELSTINENGHIMIHVLNLESTNPLSSHAL